MTNNEPIRAQWGVAMALQMARGETYNWDGTQLTNTNGHHSLSVESLWRAGQRDHKLFALTATSFERYVEAMKGVEEWDADGMAQSQALIETAWLEVLPPLGSKPEPKLDATDGNCSETPNSSIVAEVGLYVDILNADGERLVRDKINDLDGDIARVDCFHYRWTGEGWRAFLSVDASRRMVEVETSRPVVLPNRQVIVDSCDESEPALSDSVSDHIPSVGKMVTVGSQWRRNSDGKQCVVKSANASDGIATYVYEGGQEKDAIFEDMLEDFTYLFTPARDLSNLEDGWKIVGFDGTVVAVSIDADGDRWLYDANGKLHSVNGLPSWAWSDGTMYWYDHGARSCLTGPADRYADGGEYFYTADDDGEELAPTEWADKRVADGATPADIEEPWRYLIVEAMERAKPKVRRYTVELREGKKFDAWLVETIPFGCSNYVAKFRSAFQAEKVAKLLNELEAKEANDGE